MTQGKSHEESTRTRGALTCVVQAGAKAPASFKAEPESLCPQSGVRIRCVIQSGVYGAKNPGPCVQLNRASFELASRCRRDLICRSLLEGEDRRRRYPPGGERSPASRADPACSTCRRGRGGDL